MEPISDTVRIESKGTTLMLYVRANCTLQVHTQVKGWEILWPTHTRESPRSRSPDYED